MKRQIRKERNAKLKFELQENEAKIAKQLRQKQRQLFDMEDECADKVDAMTVKLRVAMTFYYANLIFTSRNCDFDHRINCSNLPVYTLNHRFVITIIVFKQFNKLFRSNIIRKWP